VEGEPHEKAVELLKAAQGLCTLIHTHVALCFVVDMSFTRNGMELVQVTPLTGTLAFCL